MFNALVRLLVEHGDRIAAIARAHVEAAAPPAREEDAQEPGLDASTSIGERGPAVGMD